MEVYLKSVLVLLLLHCLIFHLTYGVLNILKYEARQGLTTFQRIKIDGDSRDVFVAGRNTLYKFDENLNFVNMDYTGPELDSVSCDPRDVHCEGAVMMDNDAKVLEIDPASHHLLHCGSLKQGLCSVYSMSILNKTQVLAASNRVNYAGGKAEVVSFFGHWGLGTGEVNTIWLANTYDGRPLFLSNKALSARQISKSKEGYFNMSYVYESPQKATAIDIDRQWKQQYIVKYIYGFEHDGFAYFVTIQRENIDENTNYQTKLVRVCQNDTGFYSYTELELTCRKKNGITTFYNIAQGASLSPIGDDMASKFALPTNEDALYVIFGKSEDNSPDPLREYGSGMCVYTMSQIRNFFTRAQKDCYLGYGRLSPWINAAEPSCENYVSIQMGRDVPTFMSPSEATVVFANCIILEVVPLHLAAAYVDFIQTHTMGFL